MNDAGPVLIAGAGIGGLTLALALAQRGIASTVLERSRRPEQVGAGIQLSPNAGHVLQALDLGANLDAVSTRPESIRVADGRSGRSIAEIPLGLSAERRYGAPYRVLHRADLHAVLLRRAEQSPHVALRFGAAIRDVRMQDGAARIDADLPDGAKSFRGRLVVGADGVRSMVAEHLAVPPAAAAGVTAWRTMIRSHGSDGLATGLWLNEGSHLVAYPLADGSLNLVLVVEDRVAAPETDGSAPPMLLARWAEQPRRLIQAARRWTAWPLHVRPAQTGWRGPVTLIGDAAHPVLPFLAQGAALAIEDAAMLAAALATEHRSPEEAARHYEKGRLARWRRVQTAAARTGRLYHLGSAASHVRDAGLRLLPAERRLARYDWLFGWRADTARAG